MLLGMTAAGEIAFPARGIIPDVGSVCEDRGWEAAAAAVAAGGDEGKGNKVTSVAVDIITRADHVTGIIRARFVDSPPATIASLKKCL